MTTDDHNAGAADLLVTTSWDDGHPLDFRLADLLEQYGLRGTFYVAPRNVEWDEAGRLTDQQIAALGQRHEIGGHTLTHLRLPTLSETTARSEISDGKDYLEQATGAAVTSFCYPGGAHTPRDPEIVAECGFTSARTVERFVLGNLTDADPFLRGTTMNCYRHLVDGPWLAKWTKGSAVRTLRYFWNWDALAIALFDAQLDASGQGRPMTYHLWGHSWEIEKFHAWDRLERVLAHIQRRTLAEPARIHHVDNAGLSRAGSPRE